jgi:serine/threonine protein kinase
MTALGSVILAQSANVKCRVKEVGHYTVLDKCIGHGATSRVHLAASGTNLSKSFAVKVMSKRHVSNDALNAEVTAWSIVKDCPGVLELHNVFSSSRNWYLVSEVAKGGTLVDLMASQRGSVFQESEACRVYTQVVAAVEACHQKGVCHRDVKPENLLVTEDGRILLCDFGLATVESTSSSSIEDTMDESGVAGASMSPKRRGSGTPFYASPCVLQGICDDGAAADAWSLGVLLYWLLTCKLPFSLSEVDPGMSGVFRRILQGSYLPLPNGVSQQASDLVNRLLQPNQNERLRVADILEHEWFLLPENSVTPTRHSTSRKSINSAEHALLD